MIYLLKQEFHVLVKLYNAFGIQQGALVSGSPTKTYLLTCIPWPYLKQMEFKESCGFKVSNKSIFHGIPILVMMKIRCSLGRWCKYLGTISYCLKKHTQASLHYIKLKNFNYNGNQESPHS